MEELGPNIKADILAEPCFPSEPYLAEIPLFYFLICHSRSKTFQPTYVLNMRDIFQTFSRWEYFLGLL